MGSEVSKVGISESETLWPSFTRSIKRKGKKKSSKPSHFSNHAAEISPTRLKSRKSESSARIISISRDGELFPVILSAPMGFDAAEIKVKSHEADAISVKSRESEVCIEGLSPKQFSKEEEEVSSRKLYRRSWVRIRRACRLTTATDFHRKSQCEPKCSQDSQRGGHANEIPMIKQPKAQDVRSKNEVAQDVRSKNKVGESIPEPIDQASNSTRISAEVNSKSRRLFKSRRKLRSHATAPDSSSKRRGIESADPLSSPSLYAQFPRPGMVATRNRTGTNYQSKNPANIFAEREGTIAGSSDGVTGEDEGYDPAISLAVLIIIIGCLVVLSNRFVAVLCTSIWWYLVAKLLKKDTAVTAAAIAASEYPKKEMFVAEKYE